jgi:hypothetical protein
MFRENSNQTKLVMESFSHGYLTRKDNLLDISKFPFNYSIFEEFLPKKIPERLVFRLKFDDKYDWIAWKNELGIILYVVDKIEFDKNQENILKKECGIILKNAF